MYAYLSQHTHNLSYDLSPLSNKVHKGEDGISQTRVHQHLALQQDDLAPTSRVLDVPRREVDLEGV